MKRGVSVSAVQGLQRNPLIIYPGYPTLQLEARLPLARMTLSVQKWFPQNGFTGTPSNPRLVCVCVHMHTPKCAGTLDPSSCMRCAETGFHFLRITLDDFPHLCSGPGQLSPTLLRFPARLAFTCLLKKDLITLLRFRHLTKHGA